LDERALFALAADVSLRPELLLGLQAAVGLHLILDYDGTLVPLADRPEAAEPDGALLALLRSLLAREGTRVTLVTSRDRATLSRWFTDVGVVCYAEHAAWRSDDARSWTRRVESDNGWMARARPALERIASEQPGAALEVRETSIALHHRAVADSRRVGWIGALRGRLEPLVRDVEVGVEFTRRAVELRPRGQSKRLAVLDAIATRKRGEEIVAVGDDTADEDMFTTLRGAGTALHVGRGPTRAPWKLEDVWALRRLLTSLGSSGIAYR